jgi:hypothetical protein
VPESRTAAPCPRCGETHEIVLRPFTRQAGPYSLWGLCPATGEPVLALERPIRVPAFLRWLAGVWREERPREGAHAASRRGRGGDQEALHAE